MRRAPCRQDDIAVGSTPPQVIRAAEITAAVSVVFGRNLNVSAGIDILSRVAVTESSGNAVVGRGRASDTAVPCRNLNAAAGFETLLRVMVAESSGVRVMRW